MSDRGQNKFLTFRGDLRGLIGRGDVITFVTVHPEGQPTAVFRADTEKWKLSVEPLPCGGEAIVADDQALFVAGTDGHIYKGAVAGGPLGPFGAEPFDPAPKTLAIVGDDALAVVSGAQVALLARGDGAELQRLELPEEGTALAVDPSGTFLVAGTAKGTVVVFDREDKAQLMTGDSGQLHQGAVTALLFEPNELRFLSAGVDGKLLLTHARGGGKLEPEDRAGGAGHAKAVKAILNHADGELFYTGGLDGELKVWTRGQKRPKTLSDKDGVGRAVAAAFVDAGGRPHLALACEGNTIRLFLLDAAGKVSHRAFVAKDALAWARSRFVAYLKTKDEEREEVLDQLHQWADVPSVDLLASRATEDQAHKLRVKATELLGTCGHPRATGHLEGLLRNDSEAVRMAAFAGLRRIEGEASLRPLEQALGAGKADVGVAAVKALGELAAKDDQAQARLVAALSNEPREVRFEALMQLEALEPADSPGAELTALESTPHADLRWSSILRFHERKLLDRRAVLSALRRHSVDKDARVRQAAFVVSLLSKPTLAAVLRGMDPEIHRQLHQVETHGEEVDPEAKLPKPKKVSVKELNEADLEPLLEAMASRSLDTCLRGAWCLSLLGDPRAFGTLLQLSRERDAAARVEACKAFEKLGDPRGLQRLRLLLRDGDSAVRDAAFTALSRLLDASPLDAAEAGLLADAEDVRRRGLKLLVRQLKKSLPDDEGHEAYQLLERALNDVAEAVRSEAFKAAVNLEVFGGGAASLRFALRSLHADVRREVHTEVMGQIEQEWAWELLLELFDDPDAGLRAEAFEFARKRSRGRTLQPLERGLASAYSDIRFEAVQALAKKVEAETLPLLVQALDDDEPKVRLHAVEALETAEADDRLVEAMASRHADVRVRAGTACAELGKAEALAPLAEQAREPEPEVGDLKPPWKALVLQALGGLAVLGVPEGVESATPLLEHDDGDLREAAARVLAWCVPLDDDARLKAALQHACDRVKRAAALGLAWRGDPLGASLLFPDQPQQSASASSPSGRKRAVRKKVASSATPAAAGSVSPAEALIAAMTLGTRERFVSFLDVADARVRQRALRLIMMAEWRENDGVPDRCLDALASADERVRLQAARALERFNDLDAFGAFVCELLADRGDREKPWDLDPATVESLADAVVHGAGLLRPRAAALVELLEQEKRDAFDRAWHRFEARFAGELAALHKEAAARKPPKAAYSSEALGQLVFGAYVGLSRLSGGYATARVRQTALARVRALHDEGRASLETVAPSFVQALGDDNRDVRVQAFEALAAMGYDKARLSSEALGSKQRDVAVLGLKLLASEGGEKGGVEVLEEVLLGHTDGLELEAAKLLAEHIGWPEVHRRSLEAKSEVLRATEAVNGLAALYEKDDAAKETLVGALQSRYRAVRDAAAAALARKRDAAAFDALVEMLGDDNHVRQNLAIESMKALGDERAVGAMMDRITNDPAGTAQAAQLFAASGSFRAPVTADRLFAFLDDKKTRSNAWNALVTISGYDQWLGVNWTDPTDESWLEGQHPRHDDLLARLIEVGTALGEAGLVRRLLPGAKWAKDSALDAVLAPLGSATDDGLRQEAVWSMGWRLLHRDGPAETLVAALAHKDPTTQFLAAEGLALAGRAEGFTVLQAAVDTSDDLNVRRRSVAALGKLAHERALDLLLRLVNEEGHALQDEAAEAIGHLGASDSAEKIFDVLKRLARTPGSAEERALAGLRWFGTHEAWQIIRERTHDGSWPARHRGVELLRHDSDPESREILVRIVIEETIWSFVMAAAKSLRALDGRDSLEPDYVIVQSNLRGLEPDTVKRLRAQGDPARLIEVLPKIREQNQDLYFAPLVSALLSREPLPVDDAAKALGEADEKVIEVAARILGHAGGDAAKHGDVLSSAVGRIRASWEETLTALRRVEPDEAYEPRQRLDALTRTLTWLIWACGRLRVGGPELVASAVLGGEDELGRPVREAALTALAEGFAGDAGLGALATAAVGPDARLRTIASSALARIDRAKASKLVEQALDDRTSLDRLLAGAEESEALDVLRSAAGRVHVQGVALPHLVARGDSTGLAAALADRTLPEAARLGALEGLARLAAEEPILAVARDEQEEENMRRAAWRALRRAKRIAQRSQQGEVSR